MKRYREKSVRLCREEPPLGVAKLAVLKDKRVLRQGAFTGAHEVWRDDQRPRSLAMSAFQSSSRADDRYPLHARGPDAPRGPHGGHHEPLQGRSRG